MQALASGRRREANASWFAAEAERLARLCGEMAKRFGRGGRLLATGDVSDARHVAVEFVHPVIVGKRALPALAVTAREVELHAEPDDMVIAFGVEVPDTPALVIDLDPPAVDPFIRQELVETSYHLLWELVHVFLEHDERRVHDTGAASFLYPFLGEQETDHEAVVEDVRRSILMKAEEIGELRAQTLTENRDALVAAAEAVRGAGRVLALGNGGSATDATDLVADLERAGRAAIDLTGDPAILTAIANDVGVEAIFSRQVIAYGRRGRRARGPLHQRRLGECDLRAGGGPAAGAGHDRVRRLRRRPHRCRGAGRPRGGHALAAHPADPGGAGERLPRPLRARAVSEIVHATLRGAIGAMAMTGVRVFAMHAGLIREDPPSRLTRKRAHGLLAKVPRKRRRTVIELVHWSMGGLFGLLFGLLPDGIRRRAWSGPVYGVLVWMGFDAVAAPALGLTERDWPKGRERAVFVADHALYGFVLSEMRERPRE